MDKRYLVLNIGGRLFKTKMTTLNSIDDSYFQQLFTTEWDHLLDSDGHLFIDRDGDTFSIILGYLRHGKSYPLPNDEYKLKLIIYEAQFYKLPELIETAEKVQSFMKRNIIPSKASIISGNPTSGHYSRQKSKNMSLMKGITPTPVLSIPTITPPLLQKSINDDETLLRQLPRKFPRKHNKNKFEIGAPNEFKHIIHIGRADNGHKIIIDKSNNEQTTLKAIVQTIYDEISTSPVLEF
ncbi:hypothetical protein DINM_002916 [Dirofilaria immitis]|nr:hypothetical protein [Dirofilaria immitis]